MCFKVSKKTPHDSLTSTVHELPDVGGGHQVVRSQVVCQLAADGHDDRHHQMGQSRHHAHLESARGKRVKARRVLIITTVTDGGLM